MDADGRALDEQQFRNPGWLANPFWGGIHSNTVHWYFHHSPYFDPMSNNMIIITQLEHNEEMRYILFNRTLFEDRLRTMSGMEFMVAEQPAEMGHGIGTGVWVIRKQIRRKIRGEEDEISVLNTYHIVGENIYMAPVIADLLRHRMLNIMSGVEKFMSISADLPDFSPALGHRYMPPHSKRLKATEYQTSQGSKETTPLPDALLGSKKASLLTNTNAGNYLDNRLLQDSLNITLKYGDEYMDENPITGQPGDFHLSTIGRKEKDKLMVPLAVKVPTPTTTSAKPSAPPTPLKTDNLPARKGSKSEKSPRAPGMPKLKRRKSSKAPASGGGISPS